MYFNMKETNSDSCANFFKTILSFWKGYLNDAFKPSALNLFHIIFFISAFLCYIPLILGYNLNLEIYPNGLTSLSRTSIYGYSLLASAACTIPVLFDNIMSFLIKVYFHSSRQNLGSEDKEIMYFNFPTSLLIMIIGTDLFIFTYVISYQQGDILTGLICSRDILFTWSFILNLHKLNSSVWTFSKLSLVMFCSVTLNWYYAWVPMSDAAEDSQVLLYVQYFLICLIITSLILFTSQFFYQMCHEETDHDDISIKLKNIQAGVYAVFLCIYIISDFGPGLFAEFQSPNWYAYGESYLALLTFMMAGCVLCVNVITTGISKIGASVISKKLLTERMMFMRYISHEIRTPLNTTFLGLNVLKKELMKEFKNKNHKCFKTIADTQKSCDIAVSILSDMLLYDKVESGLLMLEFENVSPWQFFKTAIESFYIQAKEASIKIVIEMKTPSYDCVVKIDRHQLSQVVRNIVSNAIKFSEKFSTVKVCIDVIQCSIESCKQTNSVKQSLENNNTKPLTASKTYLDHVRFRVTDTGAGISKENQTKLFQGIIQFTPGKLQAGKGTGLGLFISKGIVDKHNGHIWVDSAGEGLGSTFTMLLPLQEHVIDVTTTGTAINFDIESQQKIPIPFSDRSTESAEMKSQKQKMDDSLKMNQRRVDSQINFLPNNIYCFDSSIADEEVFSDDKNDVSDINKVPVCDVANEPPAIDQSTKLTSKKNIKNINILVVDDSFACRAMTIKSLLIYSNDDDNNEQPFTICCDEASDGNRAVHMVFSNMSSYNSSSIKTSFNIADVDHVNTNKLRKGSTSLISKCSNNYDAILMDYQMPDKDGPTAIREIRAMGYTGKIVGLTGNALSSDINTMREAGSDQVLTKPVNGETLETLISSIYENVCDKDSNIKKEDKRLPPFTAITEELFHKENELSKGEETETSSMTFNSKPIIFDTSSRNVLPY